MQPIQGTSTSRIALGKPKVYHIPAWDGMDDPKRLDVISQIIDQYGRDPRIAEKCVEILKEAGVKPRDYVGQEAALLHWVQYNIYYVNEPGERLQSPIYTLSKGFGDCDDMIILLLSFYHCLGLPWKLVISGVTKSGKKVRWMHGDKKMTKAEYGHIYGMVGNMPFKPTKWYFVELTLQGVPLGWDVVSAKGNFLPEMKNSNLGALDYGKAFIPSGLSGTRAGAGAGVGIGVGTSAAMSMKDNKNGGFGLYMKEVITAVIIAVTSSVLTEMWLERLQERSKK